MMQDDHLPPVMQQQQPIIIDKPPFSLNEQTIRQAGLHVLTPAQQKRAVIVYDLSDDISVKQLSEFFGYCGTVEKIVLNQNQGGYLFSVVVLENDAAFATAVLLNHAILNDVSITVAPYTDFVKSYGSSSSSRTSLSSSSHNNQQSYLQYLQEKKTAYEKAISLMSLGYVKSQDAIGTLQTKVSELDVQTQDVRQQLSTSAQPVVETTKLTIDAASQKIQPVLTATKEKLDPYTTTVNTFAKEQLEKMKQAEIWENEKVKQVAFVGKVAKDEISNATKNAWNAVRTGWLSLKKDVEVESSTLRGEPTSDDQDASDSPSSSDRIHTPPVPQHLLDQQRSASSEVDDYFVQEQPTDITDHHQSNYSLGNDEAEEYGFSQEDLSDQPKQSDGNLLDV